MRVISIKERHDIPGALYEASLVLREGGSVVFPTDTLYALGVNALSDDALKLLFKIKHRPLTRPFPIFVSDLTMLKRYAYLDYGKDRLLERIWPGRVTVVLYEKNILPSLLTAGKNTVGVRIPDHEIALRLVKSLGAPLTATSANISGVMPSGNIKDVIKQFEGSSPQPDLVLDAGDLPESKPSTILDFTQYEPRVLRAGSVMGDQLYNLLKPKTTH